jgi:beta-lactamase superfamily II metal-dependent hydrolase
MLLEIDMLAVGDANAIVIRTVEGEEEKVVVVDGGHTSGGRAVVDHVSTWTTRRNCVDLMINTHPDADHINGLQTVVNYLEVGEAWIHNPSAHHKNIKALIGELRSSMTWRLQEAAKSLDKATQLIASLEEDGIPHSEPFAGKTYSLLDGALLTVLGPTEDYYAELLATMKERAEKAYREEQITETRARKSGLTARQQLDEANDTEPTNNSSVIFALTYQDLTYLFTADAGPSALERAKEQYPELMKDVDWLQVPHHGSRKSLTSDLIDYIHPYKAFISAKGQNKHHPDRVVVEVLKEIGCRVFCTSKTGSIYQAYPVMLRPGYFPAQELELSDLVTSDES